MNFIQYFSTSLYIFILCFIIGILIDTQFEKLQKIYKLHTLTSASLQLFTTISVTYILYKHSMFNFESYSPHFIFSSFLFSLQTNMINNFKHSMTSHS
jgi:hypothetical protein